MKKRAIAYSVSGLAVAGAAGFGATAIGQSHEFAPTAFTASVAKLANNVKLVPLTTHQSHLVRWLYGSKALWAYNPSAGRFSSVVNYTPPPNTKLYATTKIGGGVGAPSTSSEGTSSGGTSSGGTSSGDTTSGQPTPAAITPPATTTPTTTAPAPAPAPAPSGNLLFNDNFSSLSSWNVGMTSRAANGAQWNANDVPSGDAAMNAPGGNTLEYDAPSDVSTGGAGLSLSAARDSSVSGYSWRSGNVDTYGKFSTPTGPFTVTFTAKLPDSSSGMFPAIWMLPGPNGSDGDSHELDLLEGGWSGSANTGWHVDYFSNNGQLQNVIQTGTDLSTAFHTYTIQFNPGSNGSIVFSLDGKQLYTITGNITPEPYELIVSLQVASNATSGWHTVTGGSTPSPCPFQVQSIQVSQ